MNERDKLDWLQALRGVAALMVVFFHMAPHWELVPALSSFTAPMKFGFSGVDVFFVLSGFVVYGSTRRIVTKADVLHFVRRRVLRIFLGYWPALLLVAAGSIWILESKLPESGKMIGSIFLIYPSLFDNWLPTAWSLTYELYFYSWIACIIWLPLRYRLQMLVICVLILTLWNVGWLMFQQTATYHGHQGFRFLLTGFGIEFLAGALLAGFYNHQKGNWPKPWIAVPLALSVSAIGLATGMTSPLFDRVEIMRVASFGIFAMGLFLITLTLQASHFRAPNWLVRIGDASFSLYLLHPFFLDVAVNLRMKHFNHNPDGVLVAALLMPLVFVALSMVWFKFIEYPLMQFFLNRKQPQKGVFYVKSASSS